MSDGSADQLHKSKHFSFTDNTHKGYCKTIFVVLTFMSHSVLEGKGRKRLDPRVFIYESDDLAEFIPISFAIFTITNHDIGYEDCIS